mgnify:CR=1 FL=1|jgi:hypothetical protein
MNDIELALEDLDTLICIRRHMGAFDEKSNWKYYSKAVNQYPNVLWAHTADMIVSQILGVWMMKILVACEESQAVTIELRKLGHEAYSCDIEPCSGGHPEWHLQKDVSNILNGISKFKTSDGAEHWIAGRWEMIIAHPPCTYLTVAGNRWFNVEKYGEKAIKRIQNRQSAIDFFMMFVNTDCEKVAIENPIGIISTVYRKPDQIIQPYMFGDKARKGTCLWLKGLPKLIPTNIVDMGEIKPGGYSVGANADAARDENGKIIAWNDPRTAKLRSKTFPGIAKAMAEQWGGIK